MIPWIPILKYALPTIIGLGSGWAGMKHQSDVNRRNESMQREMNESNRLWQESQQDKIASYNSPLNQVDRLVKAGFSPSAFLGNFTSSGMSTVTSGPYKATEHSPLEPDSLGSGAYSMASAVAKISNIIEQNNNLKANSRLAATQADYYNALRENVNAKTLIHLHDYALIKPAKVTSKQGITPTSVLTRLGLDILNGFSHLAGSALDPFISFSTKFSKGLIGPKIKVRRK